jgi:hypothetical protein
MPVITFEEALARTEGAKRHLLIGNGFSISLFPDRFRYETLRDSVDFALYPEARHAFDVLHTTDFEIVIHALREAISLLPLYGSIDAVPLMQAHADALKNLLVQAIAGRHPDRPGDITEEQYRFCRLFLAHFGGDHRRTEKDLRGYIYTLNYDLLLYWALLHSTVVLNNPDDPENPIVEEMEPIQPDDGFRAPEEDGAEYVTWDAEEAHTQNIHYLHGALHLFDHGYELQKKCWERSGGLPLVDQVRTALDEGRFPLFVSEGGSDGKLERILHSGYLHKALRSFRANCDVKTASLFIFGHSLGENDKHVLKQISKGRCAQLFISLHGNPESEENRGVIVRAEQLRALRHERYPLEIQFFDATTANIWGGNA